MHSRVAAEENLSLPAWELRNAPGPARSVPAAQWRFDCRVQRSRNAAATHQILLHQPRSNCRQRSNFDRRACSEELPEEEEEGKYFPIRQLLTVCTSGQPT